MLKFYTKTETSTPVIYVLCSMISNVTKKFNKHKQWGRKIFIRSMRGSRNFHERGFNENGNFWSQTRRGPTPKKSRNYIFVGKIFKFQGGGGSGLPVPPPSGSAYEVQHDFWTQTPIAKQTLFNCNKTGYYVTLTFILILTSLSKMITDA